LQSRDQRPRRELRLGRRRESRGVLLGNEIKGREENCDMPRGQVFAGGHEHESREIKAAKEIATRNDRLYHLDKIIVTRSKAAKGIDIATPAPETRTSSASSHKIKGREGNCDLERIAFSNVNSSRYHEIKVREGNCDCGARELRRKSLDAPGSRDQRPRRELRLIHKPQHHRHPPPLVTRSKAAKGIATPLPKVSRAQSLGRVTRSKAAKGIATRPRSADPRTVSSCHEFKGREGNCDRFVAFGAFLSCHGIVTRSKAAKGIATLDGNWRDHIPSVGGHEIKGREGNCDLHSGWVWPLTMKSAKFPVTRSKAAKELRLCLLPGRFSDFGLRSRDQRPRRELRPVQLCAARFGLPGAVTRSKAAKGIATSPRRGRRRSPGRCSVTRSKAAKGIATSTSTSGRRTPSACHEIKSREGYCDAKVSQARR
jgi:hypothetical protein